MLAIIVGDVRPNASYRLSIRVKRKRSEAEISREVDVDMYNPSAPEPV